MKRLLAISDIHGCNKTFNELLNKVELTQSDTIIITGDLINRGPDSKGVLKTVLNLISQNYNVKVIRGNHEQMLLEAINSDPIYLHKFLRYFKSENLLSKKGFIKKKYLNFIENLPYYIELDKFIFVHAALDLSSENIFKDTTFMLNSRYQKGNIKNLKNKTLIHGHVATNLKIIKYNLENNAPIIGIDNGCIYKNTKPGMGRLICVDLMSKEIFSKKNCD